MVLPCPWYWYWRIKWLVIVIRVTLGPIWNKLFDLNLVSNIAHTKVSRYTNSDNLKNKRNSDLICKKPTEKTLKANRPKYKNFANGWIWIELWQIVQDQMSRLQQPLCLMSMLFWQPSKNCCVVNPIKLDHKAKVFLCFGMDHVLNYFSVLVTITRCPWCNKMWKQGGVCRGDPRSVSRYKVYQVVCNLFPILLHRGYRVTHFMVGTYATCM